MFRTDQQKNCREKSLHNSVKGAKKFSTNGINVSTVNGTYLIKESSMQTQTKRCFIILWIWLRDELEPQYYCVYITHLTLLEDFTLQYSLKAAHQKNIPKDD